VVSAAVILAVGTFAQSEASGSATISTPIERAINLAAKGRCDDAVPLLDEYAPRVTDKGVKYRALMAAARCGIRQKSGKRTVDALLALRHEYPHDPEVLYLTTHVFLQIAVDASQELATIAPNSYQVMELEAETLESQNKWEDAAAVYRKILESNPRLPNIHFRLGRALLSQPETPANNESAGKEFEQELAIDPSNATAEFWLGEIARRDGRSADAIPHFKSALKLDPTQVEAMLALGMACNSQGRFSDAVEPLERYIEKVPEDPAGHYQLALAYARTGRKEDSVREMNLQQQLSQKRQTPPRGTPAGVVPR
jgi:predicted Zn-dependent protease